MATDRETQERLATIQAQLDSMDTRLEFAERRVRAIRNDNFVSNFIGIDLTTAVVDTYLDWKEVAVPDNPDAGWRRVFADTNTNKLSVRTSSGTTINLEFGASDAITAVEGEGTLDLTGEVTIASGKSLTLKTDGSSGGAKFGAAGDVILYRGAPNKLYVGTGDSLRLVSGTLETDTVAEVTGAAGVTIDGVQVKDGALVLVEAADHPIAAAATKGQIWVKNDAPNTLWFTDDAGTDVQLGIGGGGAASFTDLDDVDQDYTGDGGKFLKVNVAETAIEFVAGSSAGHAVLDGSAHTDSVADGVTRGSLIYGNATPKWDELVIGASGKLVRSDGTDIAWATILYEKTLTFVFSGTLSTATGAVRIHAPKTGTIVEVTATVGTAPTDASLIVDVHKDGTTIFTTQGNRPTITSGAQDDLSSTPDVTAIAEDDVMTCDIDQVGSTVAGADLVVQVRYTVEVQV